MLKTGRVSLLQRTPFSLVVLSTQTSPVQRTPGRRFRHECGARSVWRLQASWRHRQTGLLHTRCAVIHRQQIETNNAAEMLQSLNQL